jgi:hypothetical protein
VVCRRIEVLDQEAHGGRPHRPEAGAAPEGGARLEETARGAGRTVSS